MGNGAEDQVRERWHLDRRRFLGAAAGVAGLAAAGQLSAGRPAWARGEPRDDPFTLGVASGDPQPDGVVLWTRLAPQPFQPGGGMPSQKVGVDWELARDERFRRVIRRGRSWALPQLAHSVHVELNGLPADREFFYRFRYHGVTSPTGRTRTAPPRNSHPAELRFGFGSCQDWVSGYYPSYRHAAEEDFAFFVFLGDYIYEGGIPADGGYRKTSTPATLREAPDTDVQRWRMQYALVKSDPALQLIHSRFPWIVTWDDHEVQNDYANHMSQYAPYDISAQRAAAYQAWYEHQPVRLAARPDPGSSAEAGARVYRRYHWGRLAQLDLLDGRQYRSVPPCGWGEADACAAQYAPDVTMLGSRQERWLYDGLARSDARWNILGSNVMMARLDLDGAQGDKIWNDSWDGFPAARNRITDAWNRYRTSNPVVITGDWHSTFVSDILRDFDKPESKIIATEFLGTSISTNGDQTLYGPYYGPTIKYNPHIKFFDGDRRGYVKCTVNKHSWRTDLQMVRSVAQEVEPEYTYASFAVQDGRPGAIRI